MESRSRKRNRSYQVCPHCNRELNTKRFKEHRRLYFNTDTKRWIVEDKTTLSAEDECSTDCFSSLDEGDTGDVSSFTNHPEMTVSDTSDLDDLTVHQSEVRCDPQDASAQPSRSPSQGGKFRNYDLPFYLGPRY